MENHFDKNISIVGLGVIGGSFAYHLKNSGYKNVWGIDKDMDTISEAEKTGMIDRGFVEAEYPLADSDIVIMAIYPQDTVQFIKKFMHIFKHDAIIMDTSGIKRNIVYQIQDIIREDIDFIGGHPMAGNEGIGIHSASKTLFNNANFILTPTSKNKEDNIIELKALLKNMGFGKISEITPEKHDAVIGYTSQLPHTIAAAIINSNDDMDILRFTGNSFGEFTRIAKMNAPLWTQLIMENKDNMIPLIDAFIAEMNTIRNVLASENADSLRTIFETCTKKKGEMK
ncbi:MAG: prephenate dehydrogenase [Clostridiales bacterium]|nr:prephenate dehydrogenase [Clostridiales bacterium]